MPEINNNQIRLDLNRTTVEQETSPIVEDSIKYKMERLLRSYCKRNPYVGYCQGMNSIVWNIFKFIKEEENAFWFFTTLLECVLPLDYYSLLIQVVIDQKVFIELVKWKYQKLMDKKEVCEESFLMKSFQWFICLFTINWDPELSPQIWDFLLLDGQLALFKSALVLVNAELEEVELDEENFSKLYFKQKDVTPEKIGKLRKYYRKVVIKEHRGIQAYELDLVSHKMTESNYQKKVWLLSKFENLNLAMRKVCEPSKNLSKDDIIIPWKIKWNPENPIWLYDFTTRTTVIHHLVYKVSEPLNIIHNYFGEDDSNHFDATSDLKKDEKSSWDPDEGLLIGRRMHLWSDSDFESSFHRLFNEDVSQMFESLTLFYQYINEKSGLQLSNKFIKETRSSWDYIDTQSICFEYSGSIDALEEGLEDIAEFIPDSIKNQGDQSKIIKEQHQIDSGERVNERKSLRNCKQFSTLKTPDKLAEIKSLQIANKILSGDVNILGSCYFEEP